MSTFTSKFNIGDEVYYYLFGKVYQGKVRKIEVTQSGTKIGIEGSMWSVLENDVSYTNTVFQLRIKEYQVNLLKERIERHSRDIQNWQERIRVAQLDVKKSKGAIEKLRFTTEI